MTAIVGWARSERTRRVASLLLLAVGWVAIVATSPNRSDDALTTTLTVPSAALRGGTVELNVAQNDAATSFQDPIQPLTVVVSASIPQFELDPGTTPSASLGLGTGEELRLKHGPPRDGSEIYTLSWTPEPCSTACIRTAELSVDTEAPSPDTTWEISASIIYRAGENSAPDDAGLLVGLGRGGSTDLLTSNTAGHLVPPGVLLTPALSGLRQSVQLVVPRSAIPAPAGLSVDTAQVVWKGGAFRGLPSGSNSKAQVTLTPQGMSPVTVPFEDTADVFDGIRHVAFELPLTLTCHADRCVADLQADFELLEGSWSIIDWSNDVPGLRTTDGDVWIPGWHLRETAS